MNKPSSSNGRTRSATPYLVLVLVAWPWCAASGQGAPIAQDRTESVAEGLLTGQRLRVSTILGEATTDLVAQVAPPPPRLWLSGGLGVGAYSEAGGAAVVGLAYQRGAHLLELRASAVVGGYELGDGLADIGLLYGRASTGRGTAGHLAAAVGLSTVVVDLAGRGIRNVVGIPLGIEASVNARSIGLGLKGFANLNTEQSFGGLVLNLRLGGLR